MKQELQEFAYVVLRHTMESNLSVQCMDLDGIFKTHDDAFDYLEGIALRYEDQVEWGYEKDYSTGYDLLCREEGFFVAYTIVPSPFNPAGEKPTTTNSERWTNKDMAEARQNLIACCCDWERGEATTLLPIVATRARFFLEHYIKPDLAKEKNN